jgi:hypothetical protein
MRFHNRYVPIGAATARRIAVTIIGQPVGLIETSDLSELPWTAGR